MARKNVRASLIVYARLSDGWHRGSLVPTKAGIRSDAMKFNGVVHTVVNPEYKIRTYTGSKAQYTHVGSDLTAALEMLKKVQATRQIEAANEVLGIIVPKVPEAPKTLAELVEEYIARKSKDSLELSKTSVRNYNNSLRGFLGVCPHLKASPLTAVTEDDVIAYMEHLSKHYADKTVGTFYNYVRGFLRRSGLNVDEVIDASIHKIYAGKAKTDSEKVKGYEDVELDRLFAKCDDYHWVVFNFLLQTGMRFREANHMTWEWVDFDKGVIHIPRKDSVKRTFFSRKVGKMATGEIKWKGKSKSAKRDIPIFDTLLPVLMKWRQEHPNTVYVFGTSRDLPDGHWLETGNAAWHRAGLACGECEGCIARAKGSRTAGCEEFFLHRFRHTFGHRCADAGYDIDKVREWMGHFNTSETQKYFRGRDYNRVTVNPFAKKPSLAIAAAA